MLSQNQLDRLWKLLPTGRGCNEWVKVKQSRYTPWRRLGERRYRSYSYSTSALDGGEWSASRPGRALAPGERTHGTHCTGGWVGPRAGLDTENWGKILCPCRGSNPDRPVVQPVVRHYTAWANPAPVTNEYKGLTLLPLWRAENVIQSLIQENRGRMAFASTDPF
jgi:hypothetical protein